MTEITHERCSELLGGHLRGEIGPEDAAAVEHHLAGCDDCRAELAGLRALSAPDDFEPLAEEERRGLREAVLRETRLVPAGVVEFPARRTFWERHAGQIVGAAASIVVILFAVLVFQGLGGDDAGDGAGSGGGGGDDGAATAEDQSLGSDPGEGPRPVFATSDLFSTEGAPTKDEEAEQAAPESARTLSGIEARESFTKSAITRLGTSGEVFRDFMQAYTAEDAESLADRFLNQLASEAPNSDIAQQILDCRKELPADDPERPLLPAYGATAEFEGEESLVLGFVRPDERTGDLSRYWIFVWPLGDCQVFPFNSSGDINPGP